MIIPAPRDDRRRQRVVAALGSILLMVCTYAGLRGMQVPIFSSSRATIRELDPLFLERYTAPPPPETSEVGPADDPIPEGAGSNIRMEQEVGSAIDELSRLFGGGEVGEIGGERSRGASGQEDISGIATDPEESRFTELFGVADDAFAVTAPGVRSPAARGRVGRGGIEITTRTGRAGAKADVASERAGMAVAVETSAERRETRPVTDVVIEEYEAETFNLSEVELLTEWMEENPADLPVGVRVHLNYRESFMTSAAPLASNGREIELFLMFNRNLRELHIVLVEGDHSVYLIDRGFQEESRSLRDGTVRRVDGEIVTVNSQAGAASSDQAREFYNIFLSWWEVAKRDERR